MIRPLAAGLALAVAASAQTVLHVVPHGTAADEVALHTVDEAIERVRAAFAAAPDEDVVVVLAAGTHRPATTLRLDAALLGTGRGRLIWRGVPGRTSLSGGRVVRGFTVDDTGRWRTRLPADVGGPSVRELFADGRRLPRARHPNADWLRVVEAFPDRRSGFVARAEDLPAVANLATVELVFLHDWSITRVGVRAIDHETARLTAAHPIGAAAPHYAIDHFEKHPRWALENAIELLDLPGEWCFDPATRELVLWPHEGERPDDAEIVVPHLERLVHVEGSAERPVERVRFEGLSFEHCRWSIPANGYAEGQANYHEPRTQESGILREIVPAAFHVERARDVVLVDCAFRHLGTGALWFGSRTVACRAERVLVEDVSSNGILIGEDSRRTVDGRPWWQAAPEQVASEHVIEGCRIRRCGTQFHGAVGIWVGLASDVRIVGNELEELPYTGISLGWMWNPTPTPAGGHLVARNHIHHVMQLLSDGGGIYTLGSQPGTVLERNVIHDVPANAGRAESNGMFLDEGTQHVVVRGNAIYRVDRSPLRFHRAERNLVVDNLLVVRGGVAEIRYDGMEPAKIERVANTVAQER